MNRREALRALLASSRPLVMPDAYDGLSARLIQEAGFKAVQCSGYSMALASRADREEGLSLERNLAITRDIVQAVSVPVMADGEDGFGSPSDVRTTVAAFIQAGVAGINIEDQVLPPGSARAVVAPPLMIEKLHAARDAAARADTADLVINGRTDVLAARATRSEGISEAIVRGNQYLEAGADLVFVTGVRTPDEARELVAGIRGPVSIAAGLPYNAKTLPLAALRDCGVARISLPVVAVMAAVKAVKKTLSILNTTASLDAVLDENLLCQQQEVEDIFGARNAEEAQA